ncbi:MAG: 50S ribosomal protein L4 [Verrucomicrobia bacterium]|nr:50S ribosomal protein L4 [Verrucomicrobiota bacterium]
MSKVKIYDMQGAPVGELDVADSMIETKRGAQAVHDTVVAYLAGLRKGTASTLRKGEVAGSNKKPWRQKGTGRARAGYRQSPVWRGGGVAFGPHPRSFEQKINKQVGRLAFRRALSERLAEGNVRVVEQLALQEPKTKAFASMMKLLKIKAPALFVVDQVEQKFARACRNIPRVEVVRAKDVSVYQLVRYPIIVANRQGMDQMLERLKSN